MLLLLLSHFSCVRLCVIPQTAAHQAPPSLGFSRQDTGVGCHFLLQCMKVKSESEVVSDSQRPHGLQPTRLLRPWDFPSKSTGVGCHCLLSALAHGLLISSHLGSPPTPAPYIFVQTLVTSLCFTHIGLPLTLFKLEKEYIHTKGQNIAFVKNMLSKYIWRKKKKGIKYPHIEQKYYLQRVDFV